MRTLAPLTLKDAYYREIEASIRQIFDELIYRPIIAAIRVTMPALRCAADKSDAKLRRRELQNSMSALLTAIATGDIWYEGGQFKGRFNARTSAAIIKLGGKFNTKSRTYALPFNKLPTDIKFAQAQADSSYREMQRQVLSILDNVNVNAPAMGVRIKEEYEKTITRLEADLQKTLPKKAPKQTDNPASAVSRLVVEANLTAEQKRIIATDWGNNLELYIKGWAQDNVLALRDKIQPHILAGGRAQGLVKVIEDNYGVSTRKAKFLARQETALLMAKFQETRYRDIGIEKYRWSTAHDARVRHDHHDLDGKVFRFDAPPVSNKKTGARNNPGQDFNCRCVAIPLFE